MINSTPISPILNIEHAHQAGPVLVVALDSDELASFLIPVFSNMSSKEEASLNLDHARPIELEGEQEEKPAGEGEKEVSKEKVDLLARMIAKDIIPEKLAIQLCITAAVQNSAKEANQPSKEDKTAAEQAKKDPENSNLAVPKEAVKPAADQPSFQKPGRQGTAEPMAKEGKDPENGFENTIKMGPVVSSHPEAPVQQGHENDDPAVRTAKQEKSTPQNNQADKIAAKPQDASGQVETSAKRHAQAIAKGERSEANQNPGKEKGEPPKHIDNGFYIKDLGWPPFEPIKKETSEQHQNQSKTSNNVKEVEADKHVRPRKDLLLPIDKNDSVSVQQLHKFVDENQVARVPLMADFPLSREAIFRQAAAPKNITLRDDQGFRLGDLLLMLLSAVLGGAGNTAEICRFLTAKERFFKAWMGLKAGMPTYRMLWFLLNRLDPKELKTLFQNTLGQHVHVWESNRGFVLGELKPLTGSSNHKLLLEAITAIDIRGAAVNVEAPGLNKAAARRIKMNGGEYLFGIKGKLYEQAAECFKDPEIQTDHYRDIIKEGTATLIREVVATDALYWFEEREDWPDLQSSVKLMSQCLQNHSLVEETKIYLSSLPMQADRVAQVLRVFSLLQNQVEWIADFDFLLQGSKGFQENEKLNMGILRAISEEILLNDTSVPYPIDAKRKKVRESNEYLRHLIHLHSVA